MPIPPVAPARPRSLLGRGYAAFGASRFGHLFVRSVSRRVDPLLLRISRGRLSTIGVYPVMLLTARGAVSSTARTTPLLYFSDGDRVVAMASNYGRSRHPSWYYNVRANPEVTLSAGGYEGRYLAREATGEDRERLWELAKRMAKNYGQYEHMAGERQIPVFVFTALAEHQG
jgi:deazaflavin-dependent oxidoreductase (nitroreductase family)